jgi:lysophospholipase L1-like esterase
MNPEEAPLSRREKAMSLGIGLVATGLLIEVGFRFLVPQAGGFNNRVAEYPSNHREYFDVVREGPEGPVYGVEMNTNVGTGGRTGDPLRPDAPVRILGLGDSQGQGQGVRFRDTAYEQLSMRLHDQGIAARVRNVSVKGYDLDEIVDRYAVESASGETFDVVIYTFVLDDFGLDSATVGDTPTDKSLMSTVSATWGFFSHIKAQWDLSQRTTAAYLASFKGESRARQTQKLVGLNQAIKANGGQLVIAVMPLFYDFDAYPFGPVHTAMSEICKANQLHCLDLLDALRVHTASSLWVHPIDHHPNEVAHGILADRLAGYLDSEQLIAAKSTEEITPIEDNPIH